MHQDCWTCCMYGYTFADVFFPGIALDRGLHLHQSRQSGKQTGRPVGIGPALA